MKFGKVRGFSLTEMMIVMLMIAVVLAASAPMVTRKLSRDRSSDKVFDMLPSDRDNAVEYIKGRKQRIYMNGRADGYVGIVETGVTVPKNSILFGNNTVDAEADNLVGIGFSTINAKNSVAIGYGAKSQGENSIAIGYGAEVKSGKKNTVAIGYNAKSEWDNNIVLGTENDTVYIPGNLIVDKISVLGASENGYPIFRENYHLVNSYTNLKYQRLVFPLHTSSLFITDGSDYPLLNPMSVATNDSTHLRGMVFGMLNGTLTLAGHNIPTVNGSSDDVTALPYTFTVVNTGSGSLGLNYPSDIRLKDVGEIYVGGLDAISQLNPYHFTFKDDEAKTPQVGVMAQDLQKVFPDSVTADSEGWLRIRWDEMFYAAINAIKELNTKISDVIKDITSLKETSQKQQATIESQSETIQELRDEIAKLSERIEKLESSKK